MSLTNAIPKLWMGVFGEQYNDRLVGNAFVNTNVQRNSDIMKYGDTVHMNFLDPITVFDYEKYTEMDAPQQLNSQDKMLVINKAKGFNFVVDSIDEAQVQPAIMEEAMRDSSYAIAKRVDTDIFAEISGAVPNKNIIGRTTAVALTAQNAYSNIVALKLKLDEANCPDEGRKLAIRPEVEALLLEDDRFVKAGVPESEKRLENGLVFRVLGFDIYKSNNVPTGEIIATIPNATGHVDQLQKLSFYEPEGLFGDAVKGLFVYGTKTFIPDVTAKLRYTIG